MARRVVDHPLFDRMRRIQQTGGMADVFPGAIHTRYEHSIGCGALTRAAARAAAARHPELAITADEVRWLELAGLLHDVGHGPYSHSSDEILRAATGRTHEDRGARLARDVILPECGVVDPVARAFVAAAICPSAFEWPDPARAFLGTILNARDAHHLDTDRIDYLWRDAHAIGDPGAPLLAAAAAEAASGARAVPTPLELVSRAEFVDGVWTVDRDVAAVWLRQREWFYALCGDPRVHAVELALQARLGVSIPRALAAGVDPERLTDDVARDRAPYLF
jgi:hypothetical protein